jgi:hypothetical protein
MSEFIEKLKRGTQHKPAQLGFRSVSIKDKPKILLIACITEPMMKNEEEFLVGADAGLVIMKNLVSGLESLQKIATIKPDIPWGGWVKNIQWLKMEFPETEADYLIFATDTPIFNLPAKLGRILELNSVLTDTMIRSIEDLPIEAILLNDDPGNLLNWNYLLTLQRLDNLVSKPILIKAPPEIVRENLSTLWEVGVDGIVVEIGNGQPKETLQELRIMIDKVSFPIPRKAKKTNVSLPFINSEAAKEEEEEEEEEPE